MSLYLGENLISGQATLVGESRNIGQIIPSAIPLTDAGLHLLDGSLIQGGGIYSAFVTYIAGLYDTVSVNGYKANIVKVGSLTEVDGVIRGFSSNIYAKTNVTLNFGSANTWEIVTKQNISNVGSTNDGYMGVLGGAYNVNYYINTANKITVELSSNGTSYNIGSIRMLNSLPLNTDFYLKTEFTGTTYNLYYSTDGETWTLQGSISSSTKVSNRTNNFAFGVDEAGFHTSWVGSVDLKGCYININGVRLWTGAEEIKPIFCTETQWQQSVSTYGVCGKFVYDSVNNTVRLPKITGIIEGTTDVTALGDLVEAGLPQHTHSPLYVGGSNQDLGDPGAYCVTTFLDYNGIQTNSNGYTGNASNSIYGNSTTVQPQTIKAFYYIVIATSTKTDIQVDIDEVVTDLNGKADTDLTNVNNAGTSRGASWAMPSGVSVNLTLGGSGSGYIAPADGWVYFETSSVTQVGYQSMFAGDIGVESRITVVGAACTIFLPVHKGSIFYVFYDTQGTRIFRFVYAVGSESEAS